MVDESSASPCFSSTWLSAAHSAIVIRTDASDYRWGAHLFASGSLPPSDRAAPFSNEFLSGSGTSINVREAEGAFQGLASLLPLVVSDSSRGRWVDVFVPSSSLLAELTPPPPLWVDLGVDNMGLFQALSGTGSSRSPLLNRSLQNIWRLARQHNVRLLFHHIPGVDNVEADRLSREDPVDEYSLTQSAFARAKSLLPSDLVLSLDALASRDSFKCRPFIPRFPSSHPDAMGFNFFSWIPPRFWLQPIYVYPPFTLLPALPSGSFIDEAHIAARMAVTTAVKASMPKYLARDRELRLFASFCARLRRPIHELDATPSHVVAFLINKDHTANTQFHARHCPHGNSATRAFRCLQSCDSQCPTPSTCPHAAVPYDPSICPVRASPDALRVSRSKLKMALCAHGLIDRWSPRALSPNPADSAVVEEFLDVVAFEARQAAVTPLQAVPLFAPSALRAVTMLRSLATSAAQSRSRGSRFLRLTYLCVIALTLCAVHSGRRVGDLLLLRPSCCWWLPNQAGLLITLVEHKTAHVVGVHRLAILADPEHGPLCPVLALLDYRAEAALVGLSLASASYVFPRLHNPPSPVWDMHLVATPQHYNA
ncbi:hypothetical protein HDU67_002455, partial [Dinochytrium kinnereticum]